jgi:hypothetical protein
LRDLADHWNGVPPTDVYHEAGHAVVAHAHGWVVRKVQIDRAGDETRCWSEHAQAQSTRDHRVGLQVAIAGVAAVAVLLDKDPARVLRDLRDDPRGRGRDGDDREAMRELEPLASCSVFDEPEVTALLRRRWSKLVALFEALDALAFARGSFLNEPVTIAGSDLARLLGDATR